MAISLKLSSNLRNHNVFFGNMTSFKEAIKKSSQGVLLSVHVIPGSSQILFPNTYNQWRKTIEVKIRSEPKDNKANTELRETIACFFQLSIQNVILIRGEKSREKTVCLKKISIEQVNEKLKEYFHG